MQSFIARQPIFDRNRNIFGYELLFRTGPENYLAEMDGDQATSRTMGESLSVHGLHALTAGKKLFVNVTRRILLEEMYTVLPPQQSVIEILETVDPDEDIIRACRRAREAGYLIALDDYIFEDRFEPLLREIDILKVDFMDSTPAQRRAFAKRAQRLGLTLLAEKVERYEDVQEACALGYTYLQGYFFCKPEVMSRKNLVGNKLKAIEFMQELRSEGFDVQRLEQIVRSDVAMSYKLLKYLNSAGFGFRSRIESIRHALMLLGERQIRKWASLVAMASLSDDKPSELFTTALVRARFCELLAPRLGDAERDVDYFMTGMLSVIDALVDQPLDEVLNDIPVAERVKDALLGNPSPLTSAHRLGLAMERGEWERMSEVAGELGLDEDTVAAAHREAITWAHATLEDSESGQAA